MNTAEVTYDQVLDSARHLPPSDQAQLISELAMGMKYSLASQETSPSPHRSLHGRLAEFVPAPSAENIDEARREMWGNFPREDIMPNLSDQSKPDAEQAEPASSQKSISDFIDPDDAEMAAATASLEKAWKKSGMNKTDLLQALDEIRAEIFLRDFGHLIQENQ